MNLVIELSHQNVIPGTNYCSLSLTREHLGLLANQSNYCADRLMPQRRKSFEGLKKTDN